MLDILLTPDGDLNVSEYGDISLTNSVRQAVRIRLLWFFKEWRFSPQDGVSYFEDILIKKPDLQRIRSIVKREAESVDEVLEAKNIKIDADSAKRSAVIAFDIVTAEETYREELLIYG